MHDQEPLDWVDGAPRSRRFDDIYFSAVDGLAESRAVFLQGCGLPQAWEGRDHFVVAELGFGSGLNILALLELWRRTRPPGARLHLFSVEGYPLERDDAARALAAWPELSDLAAGLLRRWPDGRRGFHRLDFPELGATLDLAICDVAEALETWDGRADAWFLDGFAPARNPEMWADALLEGVGRRSAPGARLATFTVAGQVRRGLTAAGFAVEKRPGFGRKRERLEAWRPDDGTRVARPSPRVAVIGAGIAGAALARAFAALGARPTVYEAQSAGAGASGNPSALVAPRLDAGLGAVAQLHAQAFARAVQLYEAEAPRAILAHGALQLARNPRDPGRFERLGDWDGFPPGGLRRLSEEETAAALEEEAGVVSLSIEGAVTVAPAPIIERWLASADRTAAAVAAVERRGQVWWLLDAEGRAAGEAEVVCLAAGPATARLADLPIQPVRGQVSWAATAFTGRPSAWGGYAIPAPEGVLFGATHARGDTDVRVRPEDHDRNREALAAGRPGLARSIEGLALEGRASLRAASPDHLPLAGAVEDAPGLFVLSALGGRGFTLAPLLGEQIAAQALGRPTPLPRGLAAAMSPARFRSPS